MKPGASHSLAAIFAHPDDETFVIGALVPRLVAGGGRATLYCATNGDAGRTSSVPVSSREELGAIRRAELHSAARLLGFSDVVAPGHPDGALAGVPADELTGEIVHFLREHRPQVVITFGPEGGRNAHRDHRAVSRAATAAFFVARLATSYPEHLEAGLAPHAPARLFYSAWPTPGASDELRGESLPVTARIDARDYNERKRNAFLIHVTQREHEHRFVSLALTEHETFAFAAGMPQSRPVIEDLFEGL